MQSVRIPDGPNGGLRATGQPEVIQVQKSASGKVHHIANDKRASIEWSTSGWVGNSSSPRLIPAKSWIDVGGTATVTIDYLTFVRALHYADYSPGILHRRFGTYVLFLDQFG
jgi:hypothetical protein